MTKAPGGLQDLRRRIYVKAKAESSWRFWGLYGHVCKTETLREAYRLAKDNNGAPGIDGVTFEAIETRGVVRFIEQLRKELLECTYRPLRVRKVGIPKGGGKMRDMVFKNLTSQDHHKRDISLSEAFLIASDSLFE